MVKGAGKIRESKDTCAQDWIDVSKEIFRNYDKYDGFVILHGTDTMAHTASALSFMFENLGKLLRAIKKGRDNRVNQLKLKVHVITHSRHKTRENVHTRATITYIHT